MRTAFEDQKSKLEEAVGEVEELASYKEAVSYICFNFSFSESNGVANQIVHYPCCITPKRVTSLWSPSPRQCACG